ncbi:amidophosphoribosyltransferase, partial [Candidatus Peregrinibacteria bacterium]|nr:amidophosphoribosyltransferase [Candidatus Peregrinibacteria bacterium]
FHTRKDYGLVNEVFHTRHMKNLSGYVGLGHTRYATIGTGDLDEVQPFLGPSPFGVMFVHNGNLFNSHELKKELFEKDHRMVNSDSDGEVILNMLTKSLSNQNAKKIAPQNIWKAVESVYKRSHGAYSVITYIARTGMVAFRDPHGIRPLVFGKRENGLTTDYIFASESVTLDILGFELIGDVGPGEVIFIDEKTRKVFRKNVMKKNEIPCIFEYVYFARPDSMMNNISVYNSRMRMWQKLAKKIKMARLSIDVVVPVPDSSRTAELALAEALEIKYREGLVKNRYIGRTFIMPGQKIRKKSIRYKLNAMFLLIKGKKVLLVDDSIVRGNTSRQIIQMVRNAGAKKVYFASYYAPVISPCLYGIDIPTKEELIASDHSIDEVCKILGADKMFYSEVKDVFDACKEGNSKEFARSARSRQEAGNPPVAEALLKDFCMACVDKKYKTGDIDEKVLKKQAESRLFEQACGKIEDESDDDGSDDQLNLV